MSSNDSTINFGARLSHYGELRLHEGIKVAKHEEVLKNMFSETNPDVRRLATEGLFEYRSDLNFAARES